MHLATPGQINAISNISDIKKRQKELAKEEYRNGEWYANDIRSVDAGSMPRADCWCFGFPCQDISIAGNCVGFKGRRSSLFFAVTGIIRDIPKEDRPTYLFIENVKNLLSVNGGFDFARVLIELDEIGYDAEWDVLNSKNFGVPQNRERVFIVGHFRGRSTRKVFPIRETDRVHNTTGGNDKWQGDYIVKQIANLEPDKRFKNKQTGRVYSPEGLAPALDTCSGGGHEPKVAIPVSGVDRIKKRQNGRRFKENGEEMFTLTVQDRHGVAVSGLYTQCSKEFQRSPLKNLSRCLKSEKHDAGVFDGMRIRRLTPKECFRLQGWEDDYFERAAMVNSDSQLYKQAGNGVTVNVIHEIAVRLNK